MTTTLTDQAVTIRTTPLTRTSNVLPGETFKEYMVRTRGDGQVRIDGEAAPESTSLMFDIAEDTLRDVREWAEATQAQYGHRKTMPIAALDALRTILGEPEPEK